MPTPAAPVLAHALTGLGQVSVILVLTGVAGAAVGWGFGWITESADLTVAVLRAIAWTGATLLGWEFAAILGKWLLVGRVKPRTIGLWSLRHLRLWTASLLVRSAPAARLIGSPWQRWHLNASGARIGPRTLLLCPTPAVPDLVRIGADSLIGERVRLSGYRPAAGRLILDRIQLGAGCTVGDDCVLEPGCTLGDHARLAPSSSLQPGQQVPDGQSWHGSPARPVETPLPAAPRLIVEPRLGRGLRDAGFALLQALAIIVFCGLLVAAAALLGRHLLTDLLGRPAGGFAVAELIAEAAGTTLAVLLGGLAGSAVLATAPRLLAGPFSDSRTFPVPGWRWQGYRLAAAAARQPWLNDLLGGSTLTGGHLRRIGWQLRHRAGRVEAFGRSPGQNNPLAVTIGAGSTIGDRFWVANTEQAVDAFRLHPVTIAANTSIGEQVTWPSTARIGEDCLIAARTAIPVSAAVRGGVGLQGSPAVEVPRRSGEQPALFDPLADPGRGLADRVAYDLGTVGLRLLVSWIWLTLLLLSAITLSGTGWPAWAVAGTLLVAAPVLRWTCRLAAEGLARLATHARPVAFSVLDPRFGRQQRLRSLGPTPPMVFDGTPLRPLWWRLRGAQIGRCVFDDGAELTEPALVTIGDQVSLGAGSAIYSHHLPDACYATATSVVGPRSVLGSRSLLLGGTRLGADSRVAGDAVLFAVDGEAGGRWLGNPAGPAEAAGAVTRTGLPSPVTKKTRPARTQRTAPLTAAPAPATPRPTTPRPKAPRAAASRPKPAARPAVPRALEPATLGPSEPFALLGTDFTAQRIEVPHPAASVAVLDLTGTPLLGLNLPQALAGFGIPAECLEDDLSLRAAPISDSAEIRSLLARVLLRQLLSAASPTHEPQDWGFIREPGGGLAPFWPETDNWVSLGRSTALVVAAIAPGPLGIAVAPSRPAAASSRAQWLTVAERAWLETVGEDDLAPALTRMGTLKNAALKAVGGSGSVDAAELDTISAPSSVLWHPEGGPDTRLHATSWPVTAGDVQHWIAVARPAGSPLVGDGTRGVNRDGRH